MGFDTIEINLVCLTKTFTGYLCARIAAYFRQLCQLYDRDNMCSDYFMFQINRHLGDTNVKYILAQKRSLKKMKNELLGVDEENV